MPQTCFHNFLLKIELVHLGNIPCNFPSAEQGWHFPGDIRQISNKVDIHFLFLGRNNWNWTYIILVYKFWWSRSIPRVCLPRDLQFFFPILSDVGYFKGDGIPSYVTRPTGVFSCNCTTPSVHVLKSTHGNGNIYFF